LEKADASCEWLEGRDCRLQSVKPAQCRAFPNDWNFPGWRQVCEAVPIPMAEAADRGLA
jgi:Fe-S-cluster containining protein